MLNLQTNYNGEMNCYNKNGVEKRTKSDKIEKKEVRKNGRDILKRIQGRSVETDG